ncbi:uncharacterized protein BDZ99DRAFT_567074 [Mytilinidion resinicola]|uniref:Uncharacterized protein n=1 Tax=Mytilinidion resinicola TaxID=574789 RepID=A0A6A6Z383_9PEZI|nr:uncharacterized protein BDZ99DRAFT_567074 [Mytilinidion resinicola]KAF2815189.1 hypothetical protein BDZ99DRAFT_567074 [Mytilinidion resinicola]
MASYKQDHLFDLMTNRPHLRAHGDNTNKMLNMCRNGQTSDPRDKVYGLLGLLDEAISSRVYPDYCLSEKQVYTNFTRALIEGKERLDDLFLWTGNDLPEAWPSWKKHSGAAAGDPGIFKVLGVTLSMRARTEPKGSALLIPWVRTPLQEDREYESQWTDKFREPSIRQFLDWRIAHEDLNIHGRPFMDYFPCLDESHPPPQESPDPLERAGESITGRRLIMTKNGYLGVAPACTKPGDFLAIMIGCSFPVILRPHGSSFGQLERALSMALWGTKRSRV